MTPYAAPWWLPGGHLQTLYASLRPPPRPALERHRWETPDGDFIDVDFAGDPRARRLMVLFHGLEGGSDSHYARAFALEAASARWRLAILTSAVARASPTASRAPTTPVIATKSTGS